MTNTVHLVFRPRCTGRTIDTLQIQLTIDNATYNKGDLFDALAHSIAGCSCAVYDAEHMTVSDDAGAIAMQISQGIGPFGPQREYRFGRTVKGCLTVSYELSIPRHDPFARNPGFSPARHDHGITGAGLTFLLLPEGERTYHVTFDLSVLGEPAFGIAGRKKGDFFGQYTADYLKNIYYAMGDLKEYNKAGSKLHIFTLDDDDTFFAEAARTTTLYYDYISTFFHDTSDAYHMILYPTRRTKLTGTAMYGICYLGLGNRLIHSVSEVEKVLAHELTHNWCYIGDEEKIASLFTEGTAEFYACYMPYHTGQVDLDGYIEAVNEKLRGCYSHPFARTESYEDIYNKSWTHAFCQKIPYIKGFLLFLQLDALIRRLTKGENSLNDLTQKAAEAVNAGVPMDYATVCQLANAMTDGKAQALFDEALAPGLSLPPADFFGDICELIQTTTPLGSEGFDPTVRFTDNIIRGLIPGSNAEKAGLQNGDKILQMIADDSNTSVPLQITVQRGDETLQFSYLACGEAATCWQYRKKVH